MCSKDTCSKIYDSNIVKIKLKIELDSSM